jgi:8-oxo-dGTP pyrophosphatase MutT (NUDIX family)
MSEVKMKHIVGVAAVVSVGNSYVLQHRKKADASGYLVLPGGKLDEPDPVAGLLRELSEEINLKAHLEQVKPLHIDNGTTREGIPYLILYYHVHITQEQAQTIENLEPDKCHNLMWTEFGVIHKARMWDNDLRAIQAAYENKRSR